MARITVEDCLDHVDNRFDLVLLASKRARQLANGVDPLIPWENDKPTVVALREIAKGLIDDAVINPPQPVIDPEQALSDEMAGILEATAPAGAERNPG